MKDSTQGLVAGFWLVFWSVRMFSRGFDWYTHTKDGMLFLAFYLLAILMGAAFIVYLYLKRNGSKMMYKVNASNRCPDCFCKVPKDTEFCPKCGRDLREKPTSNVCWNCGYEEKDLSVMSCPKCGRAFKK